VFGQLIVCSYDTLKVANAEDEQSVELSSAVTRLEPLNCQQFVELVTDYLEMVLSAADRIRFDQHLAECEGCRKHLEQIRQTIRLCGTLSAEPISPMLRQKLLERFRSLKQR